MTRRLHIHHARPELFAEELRRQLPGCDLVLWHTDDEFRAGIGQAEVCLSYRPPRGCWARAKRLRLLQMTGAGLDMLLPAPDLPAEVRVANARGIHGDHMSEFALAAMLAFEKRIPDWLEDQRKREWSYRGLSLLRGKTCAVLGLGAIGHAVARAAAALGMRVIGTRRSAPSERPIEGVEAVHPFQETDLVLGLADYIVLTLPLTDETRGLLGRRRLDLLRPEAVLVNLARGGIVDEQALAEKLERGELRGAALDVFETEPLPAESPLWTAPRTILSPHVSGWFPEYAERVIALFVDNLGRFERGEPLRNQVDPGADY